MRSVLPRTRRPASEQPSLRPLDDELKRILDDHRRWVDSGGSEGRCAELSNADLRRLDLGAADLRGARLDGANLSSATLTRGNLRGACLDHAILHRTGLQEADLEDADLRGANLEGAELRRARLPGALLHRAVLRNANLPEAELAEAHGLLPGQLGGANLSGASLPETLGMDEGLANVAETSKSTQSLFASIVLVCAYIWLTIASTTDVQLLNNAAPPTSRLPILGTEIPLVRFYMVAPLLLFCLYVYFHLCLHRLWDELAELPAVFPDGRSLDKKAHPWLLNALVCQQFERLRGRCSRLERWQARIAVVLAWGMVPLTLVFVWGRYLRAHDWWVTGLHVGLLAGAVGLGMGFQKLAIATLRGAEQRPLSWRRAWSGAQGKSLVAAAATAIVFLGLAFGSINGLNPVSAARGVSIPLSPPPYPADPRIWVPRVFAVMGYSPFASLDDASLSTKPANWSPQKAADLDSVKGADLEGRNLRYAQAYSAFLVNGYLRYADVEGTDLREADLRQADFREARLRGANLRGANLAKADLRWADLTEANLRSADLQGTLMSESALPHANLKEANLQGADLTKANLRGAQLTRAHFEPMRVEDESPFPSNLVHASATKASCLRQADLRGADLSLADLRDADLRGALLDGANLLQADLRGADLSETTGLRGTALDTMITDDRTQFPPALQARRSAANPRR